MPRARARRDRAPFPRNRPRRIVRFRKKAIFKDIFKKNLKLKHRYVDHISLNSGAGTVAKHTFSANGLYDPDITGTGHQPLYFDQIAGVFYNHYTVVGATVKVTFMSGSATLYGGVSNVGIMVTSGTTAPTTWNDMLEQGKAKMSFKTLGNANGGNDIKMVTRKISLKRELGVKSLLDEDDNAGGALSNPAEQIYIQVFQVGATDSGDATGIEAIVEIDYDVIWHEPKFVTGS